MPQQQNATPFLQLVARAMLAEHGTGLRDVAVVLPSQRAGLYSRKWLAQEAGKAIWSPQVFTMGSFLEELSGLRTMPAEELLFEGYEAYRLAEGGRAQPFGDFLQWGGTMLADISEADAYLQPLDKFYRDLRSWEEIEWTFNHDPLSRGQQRMVLFWATVGKVHRLLKERLLAQGAGTAGMIEEAAANTSVAGHGRWKAVWFAGLNALTPAQARVCRHFREAGLAHFAWDGDQYYFNRIGQEAGFHLRKAVEEFGAGKVPMANGLEQQTLRLRTVKAPNEASQAWCAAELLRLSPGADRDRTAIVLADESLFQPLMEALPPDLGPINITMGLPVAQLPVGSFLDALHRLHAGAKHSVGFFHADVARFLEHPFLRQSIRGAPAAKVLEFMAAEPRTHFTPQGLRTVALDAGLSAEHAAVFTEVTDVCADMPAITAGALSWAKVAVEGDALATEQVYQAALALHRMHVLLTRYAHQLDVKAYAAVFRRLLGVARIGLFGEPLAGVQVMGMLEARALDPQRLIVLGAQEGTLPAERGGRSFIPFELRRELKMPLRDGHDAVQAYNFLRMLQRADEAALVWPAGEDSAGPSRFILQLEHELFKDTPGHIETMDLHVPLPAVRSARVVVAKGPEVIAAMRKRLEAGLSPSALGCWLRCPLDFHFRYVLGLRESGDAGVRIAANVLGEALHNAVEQVYRPWLGYPLGSPALLKAEEGIEELVTRELLKKHPQEQLMQGQPLLQLRMAVHAAQRFLRNEAQLVRSGMVITPLNLEMELNRPLELASGHVGSTVVLKGRLDRVDRKDGAVRILDMKTGRVKPEDLNLNGLERDAVMGNKGYAVQLMMYAWLYLMDHPAVEAVQVGILPLQRGTSNEPMLLRLNGADNITRTDLPAIAQLLTDVVREMLDPVLPVEHSASSKYCKFCLVPEVA